MRFGSAEQALETKVSDYLTTIGVPVARAYPSMIAAMKTERNVYPYRDDVHPLAPGYRAMALTAFDAFFADD